VTVPLACFIVRVTVLPEVEDVHVLPPLFPYSVTVTAVAEVAVWMYTGAAESFRNLTSGEGNPIVASLTGVAAEVEAVWPMEDVLVAAEEHSVVKRRCELARASSDIYGAVTALHSAIDNRASPNVALAFGALTSPRVDGKRLTGLHH
jgi:hypothetical protein